MSYRVLSVARRPNTDAVNAFRTIPVPMISDAMGRTRGAVGLRPYHRSGRMAGPAFTVKTRPGDNLMVLHAIQLAQPGDIIVVDGGGALTNALAGELMQLWAIQRKLGGFVLDGAVRDVAAYAAADFPCFARGVIHRGPYKDGPGEINVPVSVGGLVIEPGDLVVGDEDGLVAVSPTLLDTVLSSCLAKIESERADKESIAAGTYPPPWFHKLLAERGLA